MKCGETTLDGRPCPANATKESRRAGHPRCPMHGRNAKEYQRRGAVVSRLRGALPPGCAPPVFDSREAIVRWMRRWLLNQDDAPTEPEFAIAKDEQLQCPETERRGSWSRDARASSADGGDAGEARRGTPEPRTRRLAGGNTRRIRGALQPLLKAAPLSKSAVSRVIVTLKAGLEAWRTRPLADLDVIYVYLDAFALRVRSAGKVVSAPVLGVVAVLSDGRRHLLAVELCGGESFAAWKGCLDDLVTRGPSLTHLSAIQRAAGLKKLHTVFRLPVASCFAKRRFGSQKGVNADEGTH